MHNGVRESKRKIRVLVLSVLLKRSLSLLAFSSRCLCLSCFTSVFWPQTYVECSMTNVLGRKKKLEGDKIPFWLETKGRGEVAFRPKATRSVLDTKDNMLPEVFWATVPWSRSPHFL